MYLPKAPFSGKFDSAVGEERRRTDCFLKSSHIKLIWHQGVREYSFERDNLTSRGNSSESRNVAVGGHDNSCRPGLLLFVWLCRVSPKSKSERGERIGKQFPRPTWPPTLSDVCVVAGVFLNITKTLRHPPATLLKPQWTLANALIIMGFALLLWENQE